VYWDIITAEHLDGYRIKVCFRDGKSGVVDLASCIAEGGVFREIADIDVFRKFMIDPDWHVLSWQGGSIDIAPETVYASATGTIPLQRVAESHPSYG
jgi:hypothetical protein